MKTFLILCIYLATIFSIQAQQHTIRFIELPDVFNTEYEISGMVGNNDTLYFVSERENVILVVNQLDYHLISTIDLTEPIQNFNTLNPDNEIDIRKIEMEGMTWYNQNLLLVDEGNTTIYSYNLKNNSIKKLETDLDLSEFHRSLGMEGIAVNPAQKLIYILRERNGNKQSEIYTLKISADGFLEQQHKFTINHANNHWRYSDIYYDQDDDILYGLRSFYNHDTPETAKCYVDEISINKNGFPKQPILEHIDETLNDSIIKNRCEYVSNLEGIYKTGDIIYLVSDNRRGSKNCTPTPIKTMFIEYKLEE
ncbi:MAG: SdiA-regulated domain-containing protein [Bacteroidetes bacterium]|nr:SdiA-regulated domain-containing protein [Bacteroidota bacterium]